MSYFVQAHGRPIPFQMELEEEWTGRWADGKGEVMGGEKGGETGSYVK